MIASKLKLLASLSILSLANAATIQQPRSSPKEPFPQTHGTDLNIHDPSIVRSGDTYYSYGVDTHIPIHSAPSLDGPWTRLGNALDADSVIPKGDRTAPWAPNTIALNGKFYIYYGVSQAGCRDSAIGVAVSDHPGPGNWTDHGPIIQTGTGKGSGKYPFSTSNAIDPSVVIASGQPYLNFGSYWSGIWQVPLKEDLISLGDNVKSDSRHLAAEPKAMFPGGNNPDANCRDDSGSHPIEGAFISYHFPYFYLWYSHGKCCDLDPKALPKPGDEYSIRVGRSSNPQGPYTDKSGKDLVDGGGELIYGSNRDVYAPGGQAVLTDIGGDILYYHYLNSSVSYDFNTAKFGWNRLEYEDGWPVAQY
ncbi:arabinan endo-1,5-alpha-L-arabinosidase [Aspergillus ruber CBS 135680]|uniref:Arabinan endo-1,5-alpha-L-arabinosidase n=1 Tax=Aspergillus ruber (strain CBS 135680) TaxID=1388766 RepID=A0A017SNU2_ASPRC|nr:putative arabinan endo-1,5-alpha-L-arabinosidase B [Aspergillus ruber CBS 135680]EYE98299.1 putative arabinan endo-1,5-alpha-L-arabinosidase B [Aspergillus ruber CBS 135680]